MITETKLEQLHNAAKDSRGNPAKLAQYTSAKREFDALISTLFDSERPYAKSPSAEYLRELEEAAKSGDDADVQRYALIKERRESVDARINGEEVRRLSENVHELREVLRSGGKITKIHVQAADKIVSQNSSIDNMVLYSTVKRHFETQKDNEE